MPVPPNSPRLPNRRLSPLFSVIFGSSIALRQAPFSPLSFHLEAFLPSNSACKPCLFNRFRTVSVTTGVGVSSIAATQSRPLSRPHFRHSDLDFRRSQPYPLSFHTIPHSLAILKTLSPAFSSTSKLLPPNTQGWIPHASLLHYLLASLLLDPGLAASSSRHTGHGTRVTVHVLSSHCASPRKVPEFPLLPSSQHATVPASRRDTIPPLPVSNWKADIRCGNATTPFLVASRFSVPEPHAQEGLGLSFSQRAPRQRVLPRTT